MSFFFGSSKASDEPPKPVVDMEVKREFVAGSSLRNFDDVMASAGIEDDESPKVGKTNISSGSSGSSGSSSGESSSGSVKNSNISSKNGGNHTWKPIDASTFRLRIGPNYKKTGAKAPSGLPLYELVGMDVIQCPQRIDNIGSKVQIPTDWTDVETYHPNVPPVFVVNAQIPSTFETSLFSEITDGDGWSLVHYFRIRQEVVEELKNIGTASPAVRLFARYCEHAPSEQSDSYSTWYGRFKLILRCENIDEFGLPSFITSYNGKPVLIRNTGTLGFTTNDSDEKEADATFSSGSNNVIGEIDINVHRFASAPKKGLSILMNRFDQMDISTAFCIEGREDDELPEVLLGCARIHRPDYRLAPHWGEMQIATAADTES